MVQINLVGRGGGGGLNEVARQPCVTPESMCPSKKLSRNSAVHIFFTQREAFTQQYILGMRQLCTVKRILKITQKRQKTKSEDLHVACARWFKGRMEEGGPADLLPGNKPLRCEGWLVDRSSQESLTHSRRAFSHVSFQFTSQRVDVVTDRTWRKLSTARVWCSVHHSDLMRLIGAPPYLTVAVAAHPANTQRVKDRVCSAHAPLQPWDCRTIHFDNGREETAGATLSVRPRRCSMFTSRRSW